MRTSIEMPFGRLYRQWELKPFPDYVFFQEGPGLRKWQWTENGMKVINVTNILPDGSIDVSNTERYISFDEFTSKYSHFAIQDQDIVVASSGNTYGKVGRIRKSDLPLMMNTSVIRFRPLNCRELDDNYLYAFIRSHIFKNQIETFIIGSAQPNFGPTHIMHMQIVLPPLPTQRKIAAILSAYDDLIENNTRRIAILEEMAQSLYREWFEHFRFPGYEKKGMVESPLGMIPEGWEVVKFTDIADILSGGTPRTTIPEYWNGEIPFFTPKDALASFYVTETEKNITGHGLRACNSKLYPKDTIFITARGTVGKVVLNAVDMAMNQSCYALRGRDGFDQFLVFLLIRNDINYLKQNTHGAVFDTIIVDTFTRLRIVKPPFSLRRAFSITVGPLFEAMLNLLSKNANLRQTRDLLLPKLISGEVDVERLDISIVGEQYDRGLFEAICGE